METVATATFLGLDYPTLWFLVVGGLFSGYAILDGFDLGAGAWHLFFREERSRRIALNAIGPVWDGNEVWLVIGGGALFAGFPVMYATLLSVMYMPFILFLVFIIFRAVSIELRGKESFAWWKQTWDVSYAVSSTMLPILLGVLLGNLLQGLAFDDQYVYHGAGLLEFLNPYALLTGFTTLFLFMVHGAIYLLLKTEGDLYERIRYFLRIGLALFITSFLALTTYTFINIPHLTKVFIERPLLSVAPLLALLSIANVPRLAKKNKYRLAFIFSSLSIAFLLVVVAVQLYPVLLISTLDEAYHIDIYQAAASQKSLGIMLLFVIIGLPLVLSYTAFVYFTFRGKVKLDDHSY